MRANEFVFEAKGDRILAPSQWPKMVELIKAGAKVDPSRDIEWTEDDEMNRFIAKELISMDPTKNGAYEVAIVKWYGSGQFHLEDAETVTLFLTQYDSLKKRRKLPPELTDILKLSFNDVKDKVGEIIRKDREAALAAQRGVAQSKGEMVGIDRGELIMQEGNFKVFRPLNKDQGRNVCKMPQDAVYGQNVSWSDDPGTQWCTASENQFNYYSKQGPLYVIILNDGDAASMRSFQFHYETNSFMNEQDRNLTEQDIELLSQYPGYTKFLNMMIKEHYGELFKTSGIDINVS